MHTFLEPLTALQKEIAQAIARVDLAGKQAKLAEFELEMAHPDFWLNSDAAQKTSRDAGQLRQSIERWEKLQKGATDLMELADLIAEDDAENIASLEKDLAELQAEFTALQTELYLGGPYDSCDAWVSLHAGTGGVDAQDFTEMLLRMVLRYCEKKGWKTSQLDTTAGAEAGLKSASFKVEAPFAYGLLKHENGVHRLVRMSPFNSGGTRETSFALIEVVPEIEEQDMEIKEEELKWDVFRAGGSGGQSVNTTDSAVRLTHLPTGLVVTCQNERSQLQNKQRALATLKAKLIALQEKHHLANIQEIRGEHTQHSWGNQIRSYVLHPYQMVKDHRTGQETSQVHAVLDGDLEEFIQASVRGQRA